MPRPLRITMFFTDGTYGWSESHYDITAQDLTTAVNRANTVLVPARTALLAAGPWLKYLRASFDDTFRDAQVIFTPQPPLNAANRYINAPYWTTLDSGYVWNVALLRGVGGDLYRKQIYVSGIPYPDLDDTATPQGDSKLLAGFQFYSNALVLGNYGFPVWARDVQTYPLRQITAMVSTINGTQITVPNHGFLNQPGYRIYLSKIKYLYTSKLKINGPYLVGQIVDANNVILAGLNVPVANFTFIAGYAQQQKKDIAAYQSVLLERFTHRKRGRPFDSPRGRSRRTTSSVAR